MKVTIDTNGIEMALVRKLAAYKGWSVEATLAWAADSGIRRLSALDRNTAQGWAGKSNPKAPAPGRKAKKKK